MLSFMAKHRRVVHSQAVAEDNMHVHAASGAVGQLRYKTEPDKRTQARIASKYVCR